LMNYDKLNFYHELVQYQLAHYVEKPGDFSSLVEKNHDDVNREAKTNEYFNALYYQEGSTEDISSLFHRVLNLEKEETIL